MVGNLPNFNNIDVLMCLLEIEKPVSRSYLSKELEIGEGTIRSILDILKENKLLISTNAGHQLSEKGKTMLRNIKKHFAIKKIKKLDFFPSKKIVGVQIKKSVLGKKAFVLRDEAVKNGAEGALILIFNGKLKFYDSKYQQDLKDIENEFRLGKHDLVILAYSDSYKGAKHGAISAALCVDKSLKSILENFC